ncbi:hypothetical protein HYV50_04680 [Candidatus Pacearchaeota archaeon]|nr:hypothetical protein [Candidatus Pacearchaeota archaeon]
MEIRIESERDELRLLKRVARALKKLNIKPVSKLQEKQQQSFSNIFEQVKRYRKEVAELRREKFIEELKIQEEKYRDYVG